ncbi:hypothetical protein D8S78_15190 [Natrialba swarupiae]|nr:hypothetical protein [Natrialba swarupiae]
MYVERTRTGRSSRSIRPANDPDEERFDQATAYSKNELPSMTANAGGPRTVSKAETDDHRSEPTEDDAPLGSPRVADPVIKSWISTSTTATSRHYTVSRWKFPNGR